MQKELNYEELLKTLLKHKNILLISGRSLKKTVFFKKLGDISSVNFFQFSNFTISFILSIPEYFKITVPTNLGRHL